MIKIGNQLFKEFEWNDGDIGLIDITEGEGMCGDPKCDECSVLYPDHVNVIQAIRAFNTLDGYSDMNIIEYLVKLGFGTYE